VAAVCPAAAVWAECTKPQLDRTKNEGRSEKSGALFVLEGSRDTKRKAPAGGRRYVKHRDLNARTCGVCE